MASRVDRALTRTYGAAEERELAADATRIVVFSDLHRGSRDGADDHQRCEPAYCAALAWYFERGYTLFVLGDAEELWENGPDEVLAPKSGYPEALALEARFHAEDRYERFWGNHDDLWRHPGAVSTHLHQLFPGLTVREALRLRVALPGGTGGVFFFAHGHQGTADSDRWGWLSRLFVRYVWRPIQRRSGYTGVTPARDYALRAEHDRAMAAWAGAHEDHPILIAGHTHRPVFWDSAPSALALPATRAPDAADSRAEEEWAAARARSSREAVQIPTPCYFNTGCCCFGDGDVTGLEIAEGELRLVRWPLDDGMPRRKLLAPARSLGEIFEAVAARAPAPVVPIERAVG